MIEVKKVSTVNDKGIHVDYQYSWMLDPETLGYIHCIQRRVNNGKWKMCFSVDSEQVARNMLDNPDSIEGKRKFYKIVGICIAVYCLCMIIYFAFVNN